MKNMVVDEHKALLDKYAMGGRVMAINCEGARYHGYIIMGAANISGDSVITSVGRHVVHLSKILLISEHSVHRYARDLEEMKDLSKEVKDKLIEKLILLYSEMK